MWWQFKQWKVRVLRRFAFLRNLCIWSVSDLIPHSFGNLSQISISVNINVAQSCGGYGYQVTSASVTFNGGGRGTYNYNSTDNACFYPTSTYIVDSTGIAFANSGEAVSGQYGVPYIFSLTSAGYMLSQAPFQPLVLGSVAPET